MNDRNCELTLLETNIIYLKVSCWTGGTSPGYSLSWLFSAPVPYFRTLRNRDVIRQGTPVDHSHNPEYETLVFFVIHSIWNDVTSSYTLNGYTTTLEYSTNTGLDHNQWENDPTTEVWGDILWINWQIKSWTTEVSKITSQVLLVVGSIWGSLSNLWPPPANTHRHAACLWKKQLKSMFHAKRKSERTTFHQHFNDHSDVSTHEAFVAPTSDRPSACCGTC